MEKTLEWLEEYDFLLEFILHEVFISETVDKTDLLVVSEYDKEEYDVSLESILHVTGTVDKNVCL